MRLNMWKFSGPNRFSGVLMVCLVTLAGCNESGTGDIPQHGPTLKELLSEARTCNSGFNYPQSLIDGLSYQLIEELRCMNPNWLEFYESCTEIGCIYADGPQPLAARPEVLDALRDAALAEQDYISIKAAYRDVAMQYYSRWYKENCNPAFPAAIPGNSNHQGGRAVDVTYYNFWWDALIDAGFEHPLVNDNPHFELVGDAAFRNESEQLKSLGILAFQRLWNRNHPSDPLSEDGVYGANTKEKLGNSPVEGFTVGACTYDDGPGTDAVDADVPDIDADVPDIDADVPDIDADVPDIDADADASDDADAPDGDASDDANDDGGEDGADASTDASPPNGSDAAALPETVPLRDRLVVSGGSRNDNCSSTNPVPSLGGLLAMIGFFVSTRPLRGRRGHR